jgi:hypothetical protein
LIILLCFTFSACGHRGGGFVVSGISVEDIVMDDVAADLPVINLVDADGKIKPAAADDFWFNAHYVFVQDGKVKVKENAPPMFNDKLEITYRYNTAIKTSVDVKRIYVSLQNIVLSTENGRDNCSVGSSVKIQVTFIPNNASDKNVDYEIISGNEYSEINSSGELVAGKDAAVGGKIVVRAIVPHTNLPESINDDIDTADITITLTPEAVVARVNFLQFNTGHISGWAESDYIDINTELGIEIETLIDLGYTNVDFYWYWSWCENDGPDCTAQVVLRAFPQYDMTVNDLYAYYNKTINPGAGWKETSIHINVNILKVRNRPVIQAIYAYRKQESKSWYEVDWAYCTITVS